MSIESPVKLDMSLTPLIESTPKGMNKLFNLLFHKKIANSERIKFLTHAQNEKDAELIKEGKAEFRNDTLILPTISGINPSSAIQILNDYQKHIEESNLLNCLNNAQEQLCFVPDENVSDESISETFFNKWVNSAKEVSEEDLQVLWGKILAEEVTEPNSISYLVMNTLSMMSRKQLENFTELAKFSAFGHAIFYSGNNSKNNIISIMGDEALGELQDLKLIKEINPVFIHGFTLPSNVGENPQNRYLYISKGYNGDFVLTINTSEVNNSEDISIPHFQLTSVGKKLLKISENGLNMEKVSEDFARLLLTFEELKEVSRIELHKRIREGEYQLIKVIQK